MPITVGEHGTSTGQCGVLETTSEVILSAFLFDVSPEQYNN